MNNLKSLLVIYQNISKFLQSGFCTFKARNKEEIENVFKREISKIPAHLERNCQNGRNSMIFFPNQILILVKNVIFLF